MEAVVTSVVKKLGDVLIKEAQLLYGVHDHLKWIQTELESMRCFLKDADSKQKEDSRVRNWMEEIRKVSYDAEDVIDTFICSQRGRHTFVGRAKRYVSKPRTRRRVVKEIERIKLKINDISRKRETYGIRDINEGRQETSSSSQSLHEHRRLSTALEESEVVGLQEEINTLKKRLLNLEQRRCVISIVGMGGSGKTTLAKKVYNDVKEHFDCHAFIYLSQQYGIKDVLKRIIKSEMRLSREEIEDLGEEDHLGKKLCDHLKKKRYLVVIDDIWSIKAWDKLKLILPDGMNKSRVMLTTRNKVVALHADPLSHPHEMHLLNPNEGWILFLKKIFLEGNTSSACPSELEKIGRKILAKCGGLPLAILVIGGLLARKEKTFSAWSKVLESVTESSEQCREILALSYWDLPHYLKPCFLYLGLFPEDYEIGSGRLIRLWIAEGFIQQKDNKIMEDVAEDYLEELAGRSMIQVASKKSNGSIRKCRIHDLLRDLSIVEAIQNDFFTIYKDNGSSSSSTSVSRRLAVYHNINEYETINHSTATLRSILLFPGSKVYWTNSLDICGKLLRVLDADGVQISNDVLLEEVGECVLLKYLDLRESAIQSLPSSIEDLSNLQTLRLTHSCNLPYGISNLEELRHLKAYNIGYELLNISNLRNLQTLCLPAGSWIDCCIGKLTNLRKLRIEGNLRSHYVGLFYFIQKLCNLRSLKLIGNSIPPFIPFTHHLHLYKMFLDGRIDTPIEFPPNLVELTLENSELKQDAISTLERLPYLKILRLRSAAYVSKKMVCSSLGFPRLELLEFRTWFLQEWIVEEGAMPSLKTVELITNLETLPEKVRLLLETNSTKKRTRA